jgi:hypothetical protein
MHATRTLTYHGAPVEVDAGIAEIVEAMWRAGVETSWSCEDVDGWAWVQVATGRDRVRLTDALGEKAALLRAVEWSGPASAVLSRSQGVYFRLSDAPALVAALSPTISPYRSRPGRRADR